MSVLTVCKNIIMANNKRAWVKPHAPIRVAKTAGGDPTDRAFEVQIVDKEGNVVAHIVSTRDGKPIVKCGAKVAIFTEYDVRVVK